MPSWRRSEELRKGQVLADRHKKRSVCAIGDRESVLDDDNAHVAAEAGRSRSTSAAEPRDPVQMRRDVTRPRKPTQQQISPGTSCGSIKEEMTMFKKLERNTRPKAAVWVPPFSRGNRGLWG